MTALLLPAFNLGLLVTILFFATRKPLKAFVFSRHETMRVELSEVRERLRVAQERYDEYSAKLKAVGAEVSALAEQTKREVEVSRERVLAEAKALSATLVKDAELAAKSMFEETRAEIRNRIGSEVVSRAETMIRQTLTGDDRARIRGDLIREMGAQR